MVAAYTKANLDDISKILPHKPNKIEEETNSKSEVLRTIVVGFLVFLGAIIVIFLRFKGWRIWIH